MIARMHANDPGLFVLKHALRAAIVMPSAFAVSLLVIGSRQMALFAAFGSMALLVFVDFGGPWRARLRAYLVLLLVGAALIALGTLCSRSAWLATATMAVVAFAILFAGVLNDYVAAAYAAALLTFVLPVMVPSGAAGIPTRLAGWGFAGALCIPATFLLWPGRPRNAVRQMAAAAARALAELVEMRARGDHAAGDRAARASRAATAAVRDLFLSTAQRPSGTAGPTAALARVIEDIGWLNRAADRIPSPSTGLAHCRAEGAAIEDAAPVALRELAAVLDATATDAERGLGRLRQAHEAFGRAEFAHLTSLQPGRDEREAARDLDEAYRLRQLSFGILHAGDNVLEACHVGTEPAPAHSHVRAAAAVIRTHASTDSVWLRNSLRAALGLALAVLVGQLTDVQHAFWVVLGTMSVLRSSALSTGATIAWALLGTLGGIVIGGLIVVAVGNQTGVLWAVLPIAVLMAAYAPRAISFAAGQAAFTVVVLVLFNLIDPVGWKVGLVRLGDVAIGAGVSLLVGVLLWPRGATAILRRSIGAAYVSAARYLDATITALLADGEGSPTDALAREALGSAQLLDTAVRDYLANRSSGRVGLHDLTMLTTGAVRTRRVAALLENAHGFARLAPIGDDVPALAQARDAFDAERRARCGWYASLGTAITQAVVAPTPERGAADAREKSVVLVPTDGRDQLQPGLAIAWAHRHLSVLAEFEPALTSAYGRFGDGAGTWGAAAPPQRPDPPGAACAC